MIRATFGTALSVIVAASCCISISRIFSPFVDVHVERGRELFQSKCASCHSISKDRESAMGPNLGEIGLLASNRDPAMSAEEYLLESITKPSRRVTIGETRMMPTSVAAGLQKSDVLDLIAFLMQQGSETNYERIARLSGQVEIPSAPRQSTLNVATAELGRQLFVGKGRCSECHVLRRIPGADLLAPNLLGAGRHSAKYILEAIERPSQAVPTAYAHHRLVLKSGRVLSGRIVASSKDKIELMVVGDTGILLRKISRHDIELDDNGSLMIQTLATSPMPVPNHLSKDERDLLVDFLRTLQ